MELILIAIAYILGIILGLYLKLLGIVFFICILLIIVIIRKNRYVKIFYSKKYLILIIIFFLISYFRILYLENSFNTKYKNISEEINVIGTIISNVEEKQYTNKYIIKVDSIDGNYKYKGTKLILYVKKDKKLQVYEYGNKIFFKAEFSEPQLARNTGGFNYKEYLKTKNIYGIVNAKLGNIRIEKENDVDFMNNFINDISVKIKNNIDNLFDKKKLNY